MIISDEAPKVWFPPKPAIIRQAEKVIDPRVAAGIIIGNGWLFSGGSTSGYSSLSHTAFVNQASATFTGVAIGAADTNRQVIVGLTAYRSGGVAIPDSASANSGANSFSNLIGVQSGDFSVSLWIGNIPTGTTAQIAFVYGGATPARIAIDVWSVVMASQTPHNTQSGTGTIGSTAHSVAGVVIPANGFGIVAMASEPDNAPSTINQSFTERTDSFGGSATLYSYGADKESVAGMASSTVTITTASTHDSVQVAASWAGDGS